MYFLLFYVEKLKARCVCIADCSIYNITVTVDSQNAHGKLGHFIKYFTNESPYPLFLGVMRLFTKDTVFHSVVSTMYRSLYSFNSIITRFFNL